MILNIYREISLYTINQAVTMSSVRLVKRTQNTAGLASNHYLSVGTWEIKFIEIQIKIWTFSFKRMYLKLFSAFAFASMSVLIKYFFTLPYVCTLSHWPVHPWNNYTVQTLLHLWRFLYMLILFITLWCTALAFCQTYDYSVPMKHP